MCICPVSQGCNYLDRWMKLSCEGLSNPTTCRYLFLGPFIENDPDDADIFLYFILDEFGIMYRLKSEIGHLFMQHCLVTRLQFVLRFQGIMFTTMVDKAECLSGVNLGDGNCFVVE